MTAITRFLKDERGATAIEYGLIAALISLVALAAIKALGIQLSTVFTTAKTHMAR